MDLSDRNEPRQEPGGAGAAPGADLGARVARGPHERLLARETIAVVRAAVDELPPAQRVVLGLRDVDGWSAQEVCDALEITPGNQRVLLHRARSRLRAALEGYLWDG
jgi:RNA polymerase sigma-70 factor (ECF subfamily)